MVSINKVLSMRRCAKGRAVCFDIVYEWEDILTQNSDMKLSYISDTGYTVRKLFSSLNRVLGVRINAKQGKDKYALYFDMTLTPESDNVFNEPNVVCCIIDYFVPKGRELSAFIKKYNRAKIVLISNREVYNYLLKKKCPMHLAHFPLSISDVWMFGEEKYKKIYDVVLVGRANKCLLDWLIQYIKINPDIKILITKDNKKKYFPYDSNVTLMNANSRKKYMHSLQISKIMLYATPGMDGGKTRTQGWNQVTPRFLEGIAGQCHIICRYEDNADTKWYGLNSFAESCNSYDKFEALMTRYLTEEIDYHKYKCYLQEHLTSKRITLLNEIMSTYNSCNKATTL